MIERITYEACPICHHEEATEIVVADCTRHPLYKIELPPRMHWLECNQCKHQFVDGYFSEHALEILFSSAHDNQLPTHDLSAARGVSARIIERVSRWRSTLEGTWLDVGFGNGALLTTADEFGYDVTGIDVRREAVVRLESLGYRAHNVSIEAFSPAQPFDVISLADVLEHTAFPVETLGHVHRMLRPDGLLFLSMPNTEAHAWRELDARKANPYWTEIEHLHNFGRARLYSLLRSTGFTPLQYAIGERYIACMEVIARRTDIAASHA